MIVAQYPHLLGVISAEQIKQVQTVLDVQLSNQKVDTEREAFMGKLKRRESWQYYHGPVLSADVDRLETDRPEV